MVLIRKVINDCIQSITQHIPILARRKAYKIINYLTQTYTHEKLAIRLYQDLASHSSDKQARALYLKSAESYERLAAQRDLMLLKIDPQLKRDGLSTFNQLKSWGLLHLSTRYKLLWIRRTLIDDANRLVYLLSHSDDKKSFLPLPDIRVEDVNRIVMVLGTHGGALEMTELATELGRELSTLPPILTAGEMLGLLSVDSFTTTLTTVGRASVSTTVAEKKRIFRHQAVLNIPVLKLVDQVLNGYSEFGISAEVIRNILHEHFSDALVERQFARMVEWGRYLYIFDYDASTDTLFIVK